MHEAKLQLFDGLNHVRRLLEKDGRAPRSLINKMIMLPADTVAIWCWDAPNAKRSRQKIFSAYKANRTPPPDNLWPTIDLIRKALNHTRVLQVQVDGFEADDLIATLCRKWPALKIEIVSNDGDLRQLCVNPNVTTGAVSKHAPEHVRLYKTWVGDTSDNIPGVKGFGNKSWDEADKEFLSDITKWIIDGQKILDSDLTSLSPRSRNWLQTPEGQAQFIAMWTVTGLLQVPFDLLTKEMNVGIADPTAASAILAEFYL